MTKEYLSETSYYGMRPRTGMVYKLLASNCPTCLYISLNSTENVLELNEEPGTTQASMPRRPRKSQGQ